MGVLSADDIRNLSIPDLAITMLRTLNGDLSWNNTRIGLENRFGQEPDGDRLLARAASAWAWLEAHALLGPNPRLGDASWRRVTELGLEIVDDPRASAKVWADSRLAGDLDALLAPARTNFAMGDYEVAAFAAMKAVEVEVRRVGALPADVLGVNLMRKAFSASEGPLRDPGAEAGERQAVMDLFAGAIGAYKNPASHRTVTFEDPIEAAEVIQLADLLLRIVHRAERRQK